MMQSHNISLLFPVSVGLPLSLARFHWLALNAGERGHRADIRNHVRVPHAAAVCGPAGAKHLA